MSVDERAVSVDERAMSVEERAMADLSDWKVPGCFQHDGIYYPGEPFTLEALKKTEAGDIPEHEVAVATYPRSGTAQLLEISWLLLHNCDVEKARNTEVLNRYMFLELMCGKRHRDIEPPAVLKTHLGKAFAEKIVANGRKIFFGIRNPKDTLVSFYHFYRMNVLYGLFPGNWRQFMELYKQGKISNGDYFDFVLSWWAFRHRDNVMVVRFEDLKESPFNTIKEMAKFLGRKYTDEQIQTVVDWTSFSNMSTHTSTNFKCERGRQVFKSDISPYMRRGTIGDWKNYFTDEDNQYIDELCEKRCRPVGLTFKFEA